MGPIMICTITYSLPATWQSAVRPTQSSV